MRIFAHRGYRAKWPENTMLAFRKALEAGCAAMELDVQLSRDGEVVIIHDETLDRTTSGAGPMKDLTLAELRGLDAGQDETIPTLEEYLAWAADNHVYTNIELKNSVESYPGLEEKVLALIDRFGLRKGILFSSFNHESVLRCRALAPDIDCGFLMGTVAEEQLDAVKEKMQRYGVKYLHPGLRNVSEDFLAAAKARGIPLNVWTVNDPARAKALLEYGAGVFTDDPSVVLAAL